MIQSGIQSVTEMGKAEAADFVEYIEQKQGSWRLAGLIARYVWYNLE